MQSNKKNPALSDYVRAVRLPFLTASIFPYIAGSCIAIELFSWVRFVLGFFIVTFIHCGANLINDYADSKSGADWQDRTFYAFFGGSKLIQEGVLSAAFYRNAAFLCFLAASVCIVTLLFLIKDTMLLVYFLLIAFLGFSYSYKPLQFSYRRLGEVVLFILFGPAIVMGASYIQTGIFPEVRSFLLSLPFGIFTTAILFSNEIPDYEADIAAGKYTLVSMIGKQKAFMFFYGLMVAGFISIVFNIAVGYLSIFSLLSLIALLPAIKAGTILQRVTQEKTAFMRSSQLTIGIQMIVSIVVMIDMFL